MNKTSLIVGLVIGMYTLPGFAQSPQDLTALDQKDKELQAQEQLLLKQVGELGIPQKNDAATQPVAPAPAVQAEPTEAPAPAAPVKAAKAAKKAPEPSVSEDGSCNSSELAAARVKIKKLETDLDEARNRLMISETEVERLALLVDEQNRRTGKTAQRTAAASQGLRVRDTAEIQTKAEADMPIATVIAEKAQLRTGPGKDNSPLMTVAQGTRLAIETRSGDWYRVISPTGARAWVSSDVIDFGNAPSPDSAVRGKGVSQDPEVAAFEALTKGTQPQKR